MNDGDANTAAAPTVEAGFEAINGVPEIKELGYGISIEVRSVAEVEQVSFFIIGWATDGGAFGTCVDGLIF